MFIHFWKRDRDRDRAWVGEGQRDRRRQNLKQAPGSELSAQNLMRVSNPQPWDHDLSRSWTLNRQATQAPQFRFLLSRHLKTKPCLYYPVLNPLPHCWVFVTVVLTPTDKLIDYKELDHNIMNAEKSFDLLFPNWRPRKSGGIIQSKSEG